MALSSEEERMASWKWTHRVLASLAVLAAALFFSLTEADAHPRPPARGGVVVGGFYPRPAFGFGFGYGYGYAPWGFGPYWGAPYAWGAYGPAGGVDLNAAMVAGYGGVEFNAKPGQAEVWVDGKFVAEARDLDGYPSFLWLPEGAHKVTVYKGGFASFDEEIDVRRGMLRELKVRLDKGESQPPGQRPDRKPEKDKKDDKDKEAFIF